MHLPFHNFILKYIQLLASFVDKMHCIIMIIELLDVSLLIFNLLSTHISANLIHQLAIIVFTLPAMGGAFSWRANKCPFILGGASEQLSK